MNEKTKKQYEENFEDFFLSEEKEFDFGNEGCLIGFLISIVLSILFWILIFCLFGIF